MAIIVCGYVKEPLKDAWGLIPRRGLEKLNNLVWIIEGSGLWGGVPGWGTEVCRYKCA